MSQVDAFDGAGDVDELAGAACKAFRDLLCKWCHVWSSLTQPFQVES
jgi:hypothetical protein